MVNKPYHHGNLKNELIEAGIALINEEGLSGFSLRKVAAKCNVSNAAPYSHFNNAYIDFFAENPQYFQFLFYHSGLKINMDQESPNDYPPFALFRATAYRLFRRQGLQEESYKERLAALWSSVHGIASLLSAKGIQYSGSWHEVLAQLTTRKEKTNPDSVS